MAFESIQYRAGVRTQSKIITIVPVTTVLLSGTES